MLLSRARLRSRAAFSLDQSLRSGVFGKLKLVICVPIPGLLGIGFVLSAPAAGRLRRVFSRIGTGRGLAPASAAAFLRNFDEEITEDFGACPALAEGDPTCAREAIAAVSRPCSHHRSLGAPRSGV